MTSRSFVRRALPCVALLACSSASALAPRAAEAAAPHSAQTQAMRPSIRALLRRPPAGANAARRAAAASASPVGAMFTTVATPPVPRPPTKPCVVPLFTNDQFAQYAAQGFAYQPPAACHAPWAKVVFEGNFGITPGVQYDRTVDVWLGNVNLLFGTTPEPLPDVADTWHVERDVTDLSALFTSPQAGEVELFNIVGELGLTGIQSGSADLAFYPAGPFAPAPKTPDVVLPLSGGYGNELLSATGTQAASVTFPALPPNVERAYLDVFSQSQASDEFWYTCLPNDVAASGFACGNTAFRETDVSIDGTLAGVAPVFPWIYTGGIDPYLWFPIPATDTLAFAPYRVDLTPFAAVLASAGPHRIALGVYGANDHFSETATLELYLDHRAAHVTGGLVRDTLTLPAPVVDERVTTPGTTPNGTVRVASSRRYTIAGYVDGSHGRVRTQIDGAIGFSNAQKIGDLPTLQTQNITQRTHARVVTTTTGRGGGLRAVRDDDYPLTVDISLPIAADGSFEQATTIRQRRASVAFDPSLPFGFGPSLLDAQTQAADTLDVSAQFQLIGHTGQSSSQSYRTFGPPSGCFAKRVRAAANAVTAVEGGAC